VPAEIPASHRFFIESNAVFNALINPVIKGTTFKSGFLRVMLLLMAGLDGNTAQAASVAFGPMRGWTPKQYVDDMLVGWNLGNTMDANPGETGWGNPITTQAMIDAVHNKGFKFMRLPVTWKGHFGGAPNYAIDQAWLSRVVTIANYALNDSMYVMVNIHHDGTTGGWFPLNVSGAQVDEKANQVAAIWTQIANAFKDYGDYVLFEIFNEPQDGAPNPYNGGDATSRANLAAYQAAAVKAIRATGGNNATRMIVLQGISASPLAVSVATIPMVDANTIVSLHTYDPVTYSLDCSPNTWGSASDSASIVNNLKAQQAMVAGKHGTAIIGEWGTKRCDNLDSRVKHAFYYSRLCRNFGMLPVWWDDGGDFALLNRKANPPTWEFPAIVQAVVDGAKAGVFPIAIGPRSGEGRASWKNGLRMKAGVVHYTLPEAGPVSLRLMTVQGKVVSDLVQSHKRAGNHEVKLQPKDFAPGHYLLELRTGSDGVTKGIVTF
jgi:endoglucanase